MGELSWISYLSKGDLKKLHAEGCTLSPNLVRTDRGSLLEGENLCVSSVDGQTTYRCPVCDGTLVKEPEEDSRSLQQAIKKVFLSKQDDRFHKEGCMLPREICSFGSVTLVAQDLIELPPSVHFGHLFFEYECPSCHEWVSVEQRASDGCH